MSAVVPIDDPVGDPASGPQREGDPTVLRGRGAAARLRAITELARAMSTAHRFEDVVRVTAAEARKALSAAAVAIARWERDTGHVRVLVNYGELMPGEEPFPHNEVYPISDFPETLTLAGHGERHVHHVDDPATDAELAALMRKRGRACALIMPILLEGRAWGELYASRRADQPVFTEADVEFAGVVAAQIAAGLAQAGHYERVERLAYSDPLTGLANRRVIDDRLDAAMHRHRATGAVITLMVCDINGLKRLNDESGHDAGDRLLVDFAQLLSASAARLPGSVAARLGGDEFCILVEGHAADEAVRVADDICRRALRMPIGEGVACGVASTGDPVGHVTSADRLFRLADAAQYRAKRSRSQEPVVAGRGQPPDAVLTLASDPEPPPLPRGERRRFRGVSAEDPAYLLTVGLAGLDERRGATVLERMEVVADTTARLLDAAGWWVSYVPLGSRLLRTMRYSIYRMTGEPNPVRDTHDAPDAEFDLDQYPLSDAAVRGGGFTLELGAVGNDPAEDAILAASGYTAMLAAGGTGRHGGWLVEVFTDEISSPVNGLDGPLRALTAVALTDAPDS